MGLCGRGGGGGEERMSARVDPLVVYGIRNGQGGQFVISNGKHPSMVSTVMCKGLVLHMLCASVWWPHQPDRGTRWTVLPPLGPLSSSALSSHLISLLML